VPLPSLSLTGDLPAGIHACSRRELLERFGMVSPRRLVVGMRLERILDLVYQLGGVARVIVFGSFVSGKPDPNDVDVFLIMEDAFDLNAVTGEARLVFDHSAAQAHFGASVFWVRRASCFPTEAEMVSGWSLKRDGSMRGLVEITKEQS
jgi:Nucleotidyltransferase domain